MQHNFENEALNVNVHHAPCYLIKEYLEKLVNNNTGLFRTTIRRIEESIDFKVGQEDEICESIKCLFGKFDEAEKTNDSMDDILFKSFGFNLEKRESSIEGAGDGIFVSKGSIPENSIAAMYPGS